MPTVTELGRLVKSKHPEYFDIGDEELGLKVQAKHPGAYDDFSPGKAANPQPKGLQGPDKPLWKQALSNLPRSALNAIQNPTAPGMPSNFDEISKGQSLSDTFDRNNANFLPSILGAFSHPIDDPVGTTLNVLGAGNAIRHTPIPSVVGGAVKGGARASFEMVPAHIPFTHSSIPLPAAVTGAVTGGGLGRLLGGEGGEMAGGAIGAMAPGVRGAVKGGIKGLRDYQATQRVGRVETPVWEGMPAPTATPFPEPIGPIPQPQFQTRSAPLPVAPRAPAWMNSPDIQTNIPDLSPIPQTSFPSGRTPGPAAPSQNIPRQPVWERNTLIPAAQPSTSPLSPVAQPASAAIPPVGESMTQPKPLPPIDKFEMNRMAHARAQELDLPGSPSGKSGHSHLSAIAKKKFGVDSWSKLSTEQMRQIHDELDK